jgi:hypothetical protein
MEWGIVNVSASISFLIHFFLIVISKTVFEVVSTETSLGICRLSEE